MNKSSPVVAAIVVALLAILAIHQALDARRARTALAAARREQDALRVRLAAVEKSAESFAAENAALRNAAAATTGSVATNVRPDTAPPVPAFTRAFPRGRMPPPMAMMDSPEMRELMRTEQKGRLDARYARLFQALRLPPDKLEQLKQLLLDKQNAMLDVMAVAHRQGLIESGNAADIPALLKREQETVDANIRDVLGDTAFEEYQDYERTHAQRGVVDQLASRLSYTDEPLTPQQSQALVDLLAAERATRPAPDPAAVSAQPDVRVAFAASAGDTMVTFGPAGLPGDGAPITDASLAAAQSVLSADQLAAFRQLQAEQDAQRKMGELLRQTMPVPPPGGEPGWTPAAPPTP